MKLWIMKCPFLFCFAVTRKEERRHPDPPSTDPDGGPQWLGQRGVPIPSPRSRIESEAHERSGRRGARARPRARARRPVRRAAARRGQEPHLRGARRLREHQDAPQPVEETSCGATRGRLKRGGSRFEPTGASPSTAP